MGWAAWCLGYVVLAVVIYHQAERADRAEQEIEDRRRAWRTGQ